MGTFSDRYRTDAPRAATLDERLTKRRPATPTPTLAPSLARALAFWERAYDQREPGDFDRRLALDHLDRATLEACLASDEALPDDTSWRDALGELVERMDDEPFDPTASQPFFELFAGPARAAVDRLRTPPGVSLDRSVPEALRREFARQLAGVAAPSLYAAFSAARSAAYATFVAHQRGGGFEAHLRRYPVLARRLVWLATQWQARTQALLDALAEDGPVLTSTFGLAAPLRVESYDGALSERHDDGRQVCRLTLAPGIGLIFKPRPSTLEVAWHGLLSWLHDEGCPSAPPALRAVAGRSHGWFEVIQASAAADDAAVARFARRAGGLACLTWLLNASDLHSENVIATGDGPVVIDAETLLQPRAPAPAVGAGTALQQARQRIQGSVLATGLVHFPTETDDGTVLDHSGLLGVEAEAMPLRSVVRWRGLGTDSLRRESCREAPPATGHALRDDGGRRVELTLQLTHVMAGFDAMWAFLRARRNALRGGDGPLAPFRDAATRVVLRPSNLYAQVLQQLLTEPTLQSHGALPGMLIDTLNRHLLRRGTAEALWPLTREERQQLERLDVPVARAPVSGRSLGLGDAAVEEWFVASGWEVLGERLERLSDDAEQARQAELLRGALSSDARHVGGPGRLLPAPAGDPTVLLERFARDLGERILGAAITGADGSLTWLAPAALRNQDRSDRGAGHYLYGGSAGIAVFLAALGRHSDDARYGEAAGRALLPVEQLFASDGAAVLLLHEGIGLCHGLGSLIVACCHLAHLTDEDRYRLLAGQIARALTPERIAADRRLDIEGGSAGALIALLLLAREAPDVIDGEALDARLAGLVDHLLRRQEAAPHGAAWPNERGVLQTGLAHGAGGIAAALAGFATRWPSPAVRAAIEQAVAYENSHYADSAANWLLLDRRADGEPVSASMVSWCYGAPGIALARRAIADALPDLAAIDEDIDRALATTRRAGAGVVDHLCCGAAGLADVLLELGRTRGDEADVDRARQLVAALAAGHLGGDAPLVLHPDEAHNRVFRPGLFRGLAGIGHVALRLLDPTVPAVTVPGPWTKAEARR